MAIAWDLAMTATEFYNHSTEVAHPAWMSCHFSPYGLGLSNLPKYLPKGAVLIIDDCTPPHGHDPKFISAQLQEITRELECSCVLLDFQRPKLAENSAIARLVSETLPCPVGVSSLYEEGLNCALFLPPVPLHVPVEEYLSPWSGRDIWLEVALDAERIAVTDQGATFTALGTKQAPENTRKDENLCCSYTVSVSEQEICFSLYRTQEDLLHLLHRAEAQGISRAMGLYQELGSQKV